MDDTDSPPRAPPIKYTAPLGTRWAKEKAAAGGPAAFDLPTDPKNIGPWVLGECIGKGASGRVKIARHRHTRQLAAVKILPITPLVNSRASLATQQAKSEKQRLGIDREITMMKLMNHPNIMRIYDVYEGERELFLVLEYVDGGELFDFLVNRGRLPPNEALLYFRQIIYGLNYAHTFSIIHRDLKPENILIASLEPPSIKIADWGMAAFAPPSLQLETSCGSPHYASPEIVNGEKYFGTATDIWSCGVILFALLTGRLPFDDKNVRTLLSKVKSGKYEMPAWIDPLAKDLLTRMLVVDVKKRISIPEVMAHPWFTKIILPSSSQTPLVTPSPVLPPSPSTLARPIPSPDLIDPELFSSLRVIWGRHAESQGAVIQRDLCSPAGQGTYAKAFYFLLNKYREETLRNRVVDSEANQHARVDSGSDLGHVTTASSTAMDVDSGLVSQAVSLPQSTAMSRGPPTGEVPSVVPNTHTASGIAPLEPIYGMTDNRNAPSFVFGSQPPGAFRLPPRKASQGPAGMVPETRRSVGPFMSSQQRPTAAQRSSSDPVDRAHFSMEAYPTQQAPARSPSVAQHSRRPSASVGRDPENCQAVAAPLSPRPGPREIPHPTASDIVERVNDVIHAASKGNRHQSMMAVLESVPRARNAGVGQAGSVGGRARSSTMNAVGDKENAPEGWTYVEPNVPFGRGIHRAREASRDSSNRDSLIPLAALKLKKEKERKARPPPLELKTNQQRRNFLGSPISTNSPTSHAPSSSKVMASPVVGEFRGWFSNLFNWKPGSASTQPSVFYSTEDGPQTRDLSFALFQSMGFVITRNLAEQASENCEVYHCRLESFVPDPQTNGILKPNRFKVEFCFMSPTPGPMSFPPPSPAPMQVDGNSSFAISPIPSPNYLSTPTPGFGFRPRQSIVPGGTSSGRSSNNSSGLTTPTGLATPMESQWEVPPGVSCVITLVHEKGSTSTFKAVRERLKEVFNAQGTALASCFSPAIPGTPAFLEAQQQNRMPS